MSFESTEDIRLDKLVQKTPFVLYFSKNFPNWFNHDLDWASAESKLTPEEFEELKGTFVLSEAAKRFVIARNLRLMLDGEWKAVDIVVNLATLYASMSALHHVVTTTLATKPMVAKIGAGLVTVGVGTGLAAAVWTLSERSVMTRINKSLKADGYSEGGVEYLEKQVRRGQLLSKVWYENFTPNLFKARLISEEGETTEAYFSSFQNPSNSPSVHLDFFRST